MTFVELKDAINRIAQELDVVPGNFSIFAPTKDSGDPIDVTVVPGQVSFAEFAEMTWLASMTDDEIEEMALAEANARELSYFSLWEEINA